MRLRHLFKWIKNTIPIGKPIPGYSLFIVNPKTLQLIPKGFQGELLIGDYYKKNYILVDDRYVFPIEYVEKTNEFPYLKKESSFDETIDRIKQQSVLLSEKEKDKLDRKRRLAPPLHVTQTRRDGSAQANSQNQHRILRGKTRHRTADRVTLSH